QSMLPIQIKATKKLPATNSSSFILYMLARSHRKATQMNQTFIRNWKLMYGKCIFDEPQFVCDEDDDDSQTVPQSKVCDFRKDCDNGRDEYFCGECAFYDEMCNYKILTN